MNQEELQAFVEEVKDIMFDTITNKLNTLGLSDNDVVDKEYGKIWDAIKLSM